MCHHNKHLMRYFEFLHGSRIICLPLNIPEKLHWQRLFRKARGGRDLSPWSYLIQYNTHAATSTIQTNRTTTTFFFGTNPLLGYVLIHSVDNTYVLVVTVELIWLLFLNILSFNFVPTPNELYKLHCFFAKCTLRCSKWPRFFFYRCLSPMIVHLRNLFLLSTPDAWMFLIPRWVSRRKDWK